MEPHCKAPPLIPEGHTVPCDIRMTSKQVIIERVSYQCVLNEYLGVGILRWLEFLIQTLLREKNAYHTPNTVWIAPYFYVKALLGGEGLPVTYVWQESAEL